VQEETDEKVKEKVAAIKSRTDLIRRLSIVVSDSPELHFQALSSSRRQRHSSATSRRSVNQNSLLGTDDDTASQRGLIDEHSVEERMIRLHDALEEIEHETQISVTVKPSNYSTTTLSIGKDVMTIRDWLRLPQSYIVSFSQILFHSNSFSNSELSLKLSNCEF